MSGVTRIHGEPIVKRRQVLLAAAGVAASALGVPSRALAAPRPPTLVADPAAADRDFVRWLSVHDPRAAVRAAAAAAVTGGAAAFLATGYASASSQAAQARANDLDYANRMATGHPAQSYPWVNAAAGRAANGTDAELATFRATGYAAALAADEAHVPYDDGAALVDPEDFDLVRGIRYIDTGPTVLERSAEVRTDADVAEFLRHGWLSAARIDVDAYRAQYVAHEWDRWREARYRVPVAVSLDQAAREGTADPYAAMRAWDDVRERFARQPSGWAERERYARSRADDWLRISYTAADRESPLWAPLTVEAPDVRSQWLAEFTGATQQGAWWSELIQYAQAARDEWINNS